MHKTTTRHFKQVEYLNRFTFKNIANVIGDSFFIWQNDKTNINLNKLINILLSFMYRLSQLEELRVLDLSGNRTLEEVPEMVYSLSKLTELWLQCCELSNISDRYVCVR